jgi:hypothetical protein
MPGADAVKIETEIRMADTAASDFDDDLIRFRLLQLEVNPG